MLQQTKQCQICRIMSSVGVPIDPHHIIHKSQGGTDHDHNVQTTCRNCHDYLHGQRGEPAWEIVVHSAERLLVMQGSKVIVDIPYPPGWWSQGHHIEGYRVIADAVHDQRQEVQWLDTDGLTATHDGIKRIEMELWLTRVKAIAVAMLRVPYGQRSEKMAAVTSELGISRTLGHDLHLVHKEYGEDLSTYLEILEPSFIILAAKASDPQAALVLAVDMKAREPRTTVQKYREALKVGKDEPTCGWLHSGVCGFHENHRCQMCPEKEV